MLFRGLFAVMATFLAIFAPSLAAGTDLSRYYGMWTVKQGGMAGKCQLELTGQSFAGRLSGHSILCLGPLAFMNGWAPSGRGVVLLGMDGRPIITLESARGILVGRLLDGSMISMFPAGGQ